MEEKKRHKDRSSRIIEAEEAIEIQPRLITLAASGVPVVMEHT